MNLHTRLFNWMYVWRISLAHTWPTVYCVRCVCSEYVWGRMRRHLSLKRVLFNVNEREGEQREQKRSRAGNSKNKNMKRSLDGHTHCESSGVDTNETTEDNIDWGPSHDSWQTFSSFAQSQTQFFGRIPRMHSMNQIFQFSIIFQIKLWQWFRSLTNNMYEALLSVNTGNFNTVNSRSNVLSQISTWPKQEITKLPSFLSSINHSGQILWGEYSSDLK